MKNTNSILSGGSKTNQSLHKLIDTIIRKATQFKNTRILNNVSESVYINSNEDVVASVIEGMLYAIITNAADGDVDINAKELFGNTIKVSVKDNNCYNTYAVACSLQNTVNLAEQMGGYLNITNQRQKITTIEFSFPFVRDDSFHERHDEDES